MLRNITFSNYRAFEVGSYPIKPITIFIGQNSIGKTSALQIPLLLKQTLAIQNQAYYSALKVQGREISFGDQINIFRNKDGTRNLSLGIEFSNSNLTNYIKSIPNKSLNNYIEDTSQLMLYLLKYRGANLNIEHKKFTNKLSNYLFMDDFDFSKQDESFFDKLLSAKNILSNELSKDYIEPYILENYSARRLRRTKGRPQRKFTSLARSDLNRTLNLVKSFKEFHSERFGIEFQFKLIEEENNSKINISQIEYYAPGKNRKTIAKLSFDADDLISIESDIIPTADLNAYIKTISKHIRNNELISSIYSTNFHEINQLFPEIFLRILSKIHNECLKYFSEESIGHIGPLRAHPKRFYLLDTSEVGSSDGDSLVEALRENEDLKKSVNNWLSRFNIHIDVDHFAEIIYRLSVANKHTNISMDITDVGFGISQILPILAEGFLSPDEKIIIVEQPEIHLHPQAQSDLGDLFIDMAKIAKTENSQPKKFFLIETHSEYLLNRIRRRISEGTVSHQDVAIVYVEPDENGVARTRQVAIRADGSFEWPRGFIQASLDDTMAFATRHSRK
ncbi:MAG: AAA family ATPase [Nisaea sp.]|uniref:AAA family ATPase n=1 Tax=Nisaea sp. TaxID=2024842 RepID=UPI003298C1D6